MPLTDSSDALSQPLFWSKARRHLLGADPVLAKIMERCGPEQLVPRNDAFFSLARSIVGQQISVKAAQSIWDRLVKELGGMTVRKVAAANQERLRSCGITRQKSGYLLDLAKHFQDGKLGTQSWNKLDDEQVIENLIQVRGVGRWTAEMFLIFHLL
ncbi:MAG TPA: DNA-3-methyladenine glycosylase 2 family protein, partial [Alphaproteobacteria bacterium]|nr:DNA-3-methyladenine glycosylase 2 family protein [Alphaproteobacteria bacterium]